MLFLAEKLTHAPLTHEGVLPLGNFFHFLLPQPGESLSKVFFRLFCTGDGLFCVAIVSILFFLLYHLLTSPLKSEIKYREIVKKQKWQDHCKRFTTASGRNVGARYYDGFQTSNWRETINSDSNVASHTVDVSLSHRENYPSYELHRNTKVTVAGDPKTATLSVITHHDICSSFKHGLLPLSRDLILHCNNQNSNESETNLPWKKHVENLCFYHIAAPGHLEGDSTYSQDSEDSFLWTMDALAQRLNDIIHELGIKGRFVCAILHFTVFVLLPIYHSLKHHCAVTSDVSFSGKVLEPIFVYEPPFS